MSMITLLDDGRNLIQVREDVADQYALCPRCHGHPHRMAQIGQSLYGDWRFYQAYRACFECDNGLVRVAKPDAARPPLSTTGRGSDNG